MTGPDEDAVEPDIESEPDQPGPEEPDPDDADVVPGPEAATTDTIARSERF